MNSKVRAKKNIIRLGALLLAALMIIGLLATVMGPGDITGTGFDYSAPFTAEGHFKGVKASDCVTLPQLTAWNLKAAPHRAPAQMLQSVLHSTLTASLNSLSATNQVKTLTSTLHSLKITAKKN